MEETEETKKETVKKEPTEEEETTGAAEPQPEEEPAEEEQTKETSTEEELDEEPIVSPSFISRSAPVDKKKYIFIALIVIVGVGVIAGGILVYKRAMSKKEAVPAVASPTPAPIETPQPSPVSELKREDLKIQILNGSGITGVAGEAQELLQGLGYQEIETGNADSYDYEETEISIKEDKKDYLEMLIDDLEDEYTLGTESATLEEESEFDAVIIIGSQ